MTLDPETGDVISSWGSNFFYIPHGITIDWHDNVWVTDVALHQVFKFKPGGSSTPLLEFGSPFEPGSSFLQFCKPTSVAVARTGEIFIADGYCNNRVLKFNAAGGLLRIIPNPPGNPSIYFRLNISFRPSFPESVTTGKVLRTVRGILEFAIFWGEWEVLTIYKGIILFPAIIFVFGQPLKKILTCSAYTTDAVVYAGPFQL